MSQLGYDSTSGLSASKQGGDKKLTDVKKSNSETAMGKVKSLTSQIRNSEGAVKNQEGPKRISRPLAAPRKSE